MAKHVAARTAEVPPGCRKLVTVRGRPIAIFNVEGEYFAILDRCPHQGASLCHGKLTGILTSEGPGHFAYDRPGELLRCPWHGWEFDIRTGKSWFDPRNTQVKTYDVAVQPGAALCEGPFRAETFEIAVEEDYLVVEL